jgi:ribosomal protein L10
VKEQNMDRGQKTEAVAALNAIFKDAGVVVVTRNLGLTVAQSTELRTKMRDEGASFKVSKNRLAKLALEGTDYGPIADMLQKSQWHLQKPTIVWKSLAAQWATPFLTKLA